MAYPRFEQFPTRFSRVGSARGGISRPHHEGNFAAFVDLAEGFDREPVAEIERVGDTAASPRRCRHAGPGRYAHRHQLRFVRTGQEAGQVEIEAVAPSSPKATISLSSARITTSGMYRTTCRMASACSASWPTSSTTATSRSAAAAVRQSRALAPRGPRRAGRGRTDCVPRPKRTARHRRSRPTLRSTAFAFSRARDVQPASASAELERIGQAATKLDVWSARRSARAPTNPFRVTTRHSMP